MANRKASIWLYVKTPAGWRYCKPVTGKNNKIKPGWAHVNSHEEHHPDASYYVRHREGSKTVWTKYETLSTAVGMCDVQKSYLAARANGIKVQNDPTPLLMVYEMPRFLEEYRLAKAAAGRFVEPPIFDFTDHSDFVQTKSKSCLSWR